MEDVMQINARSLFLVSASWLTIMSGSAFAQEASAASNQSKDSGIGEIIVTAQKRSESLQRVPIAVSAFSQETLKDRGFKGGADLQNAVPNVSFNDTGFGRYSFQIRGIGAQIQGASADTGVGIHQNNIPLTVNRLASAEFYDIERIEVLRGPQGTLYGRNATGGVVNNITATPKDKFSAEVMAEGASYGRMKLAGHINVPLSDTFALRVAGTMLKRGGDTVNSATGGKINSRDIWSTRVTAQWTPSSALTVRAMWEHFDQNDSSGGNAKMVCAPDAGPTSIGGVATNPFTQAMLSTGCLNSTAINDPRNTGVASSSSTVSGIFGLLFGTLPLNSFAGRTLSRDLGTVQSAFTPSTRARNDLASLNIEYKITPSLSVTSLTAYSYDKYRSLTPFFGGLPTSGFLISPLTPAGSFTDPQLGTSGTIDNRQLVRTTGKQFSQELRLQSAFDGKFNFNIGGIYVDYRATNEIIILANTTTQAALAQNAGGAGIYVDPNAEPDGTGHNYYNNSSPYHLKSAAAFGEAYFKATDTLKATLGLRYTNDSKQQTTYPIVMLAPGRGFPATTPQQVDFSEVTGRFTLDWRPHVEFTDDTLVYASYSRGYKGGGFNPGGLALTGISPNFKPEFVNSFEIGTKNSLFNRRLTLNLTGFYYDYSNYQIAQGVNMTIATQNVNATVKGLEFEAIFQPVRGLRFDTQIGYLDSKIKNGSSINPNDPTQGDPTLSAVRSIDSGSFGSVCAIPTAVLAGVQSAINAGFAPSQAMASLCTGPFASPYASGGVPVQLSGHQLPYAPHVTLSVGGEYGMDVNANWRATLRADYHWQSQSYATMYNTTFDRINSYDNLNLSFKLANESQGFTLQAFARSLLSQQSVTTIQVGTATSGYARTVFGKDRTSYGLALTKRF
jgi:outer membrane receptor protein involved in Fe transport